jgi:hypothetical protein
MNRLRLPILAALACLTLTLVAACSGGTAEPLQPVGGDPAARAPSEGGDGFEAPSTSAPQAPDDGDQLIVYTGTLEIEVADLRPAMDQAEHAVAALGGHVAASRLQDSTSSKRATVTYRIPAERWSEALVALRALGTRLVTETTGSENVTAQVVDIEARLTNLRTTEAALQAIMDRATTITDVLKVQEELTTVRGEIERLTAERDLLAQRAALATLDVSFVVPVAETSRASEGWDLGHEVDNAIAALVRIAQVAVSFVIWLVVVGLPILVPILVVLFIAIRLRRRWVANHPPSVPPLAPASTAPPPGPWTSDS